MGAFGSTAGPRSPMLRRRGSAAALSPPILSGVPAALCLKSILPASPCFFARIMRRGLNSAAISVGLIARRCRVQPIRPCGRRLFRTGLGRHACDVACRRERTFAIDRPAKLASPIRRRMCNRLVALVRAAQASRLLFAHGYRRSGGERIASSGVAPKCSWGGGAMASLPRNDPVSPPDAEAARGVAEQGVRPTRRRQDVRRSFSQRTPLF
jgi:hypothetical protein